MKRLKLYTILIALCGLSACTDERVEEYELLQDCENHFQATSYLVAIKTCTKAAEMGIPKAQWLLANIYQYDLAGNGAQPELAFEWFFKSAEGGNPEAQTLVGNAYLYGSGVNEDFEQAYRWLNKAANNGEAGGEYSLGVMFFEGKGRQKDVSAAISWFKKAANKEHAVSINNLAWIYATSSHKAFRSTKKAQFWAKKLALVEEKTPVFLDTLAAVHASAGEFVEAIKLQNQAIELLPEDIDENKLLEFQKHLESYQSQQPWQESLD